MTKFSPSRQNISLGQLALSLLITSSILSCSTTNNARNPSAEEVIGAGRGTPAEYDMGPPKDSEWPDIFAETPNYRAYGKAVYQAAAKMAGVKDDGQEKFRWKVGPMWYRGRLSPESVKVFVIGQEGAQDENTSNRTFTGSTGTKMQNFINYFGIDRSYLFMNTFIYTITGQYGERPEPTDTPQMKKEKEVFSSALFWLAQSPNSIVVQHRHRMFDYMLKTNKDTLRLVIGVGAAGKDSLATWINAHGGKCTVRQLSSSYCDASVLAPGVIAIGVMHPGAASARNGGANAATSLRDQFARRASTVAQYAQKNPGWLKPDPGMRPNFSKAYYYKDAVIPHRDFAFGTIWRLGKDGTTTNRRGADGIQIFSDKGCYNNAVVIDGKCDFSPKPKTLNVQYDDAPDLKSDLKMATGDLPYESPKSKVGRRDYDVGPGKFANILMGQDGAAWPSFNSLGVTQDDSFGYGPIYRGNLEKPEVVVLGDQESHDDMFSTRALTGTGGQRLQTFLEAMGAKNYVIIRTLPVDTMDLPVEKVKAIALTPQVAAVRNKILGAVINRNTKLVIALGPVAAEVIKQYKTDVPVVNLVMPLEESHVARWQQSLQEIASMKLGFTAGSYRGELTAIPRADLPAHTRWWMGTSGSRANRAFVGAPRNRQWNGDYYQFNAPNWVNSRNYPAMPNELSREEMATLSSIQLTAVQAEE